MTGLAESRLDEILDGHAVPKMPELITIADACSMSVDQLLGTSTADRVRCVLTRGAADDALYRQLLSLVELDAYLDAHAIDPRRRPS